MPPKKVDKRKKVQTPAPPTPEGVKKIQIKIKQEFVPKGELTGTQIRELIAQHNRMMKIDIPKGTKRSGLIQIIRDNGYKIDHVGKKLVPDVKMKRKPVVPLPTPKPKKTPEEAAALKESNIKKKVSKAKEVLTKHEPSYAGKKPSGQFPHSMVEKWGPYKKGVTPAKSSSSDKKPPPKPPGPPKISPGGTKTMQIVKKSAKPKTVKKVIKLAAGVSPAVVNQVVISSTVHQLFHGLVLVTQHVFYVFVFLLR